MTGAAYDSAVADAVLYLRAHREAAGLTPTQLYRAAGVSRATVYRLENGEVGGVDFGVLGALAEVLGVEPADLFRPPPPAKAKAPAKARRRP